LPDEDTGRCPSSEDVLGALQTRLAAGDLDGLRPHVEQILVQDRGVATTLSFVSQVLPDVEADALSTLAAVLGGDDGRAALDVWKPTVFSVVDYLHGTSEAIPGPHDEPLAALHAIVTGCDAPATTRMFRDLLALQVRPGAAGEPRWVLATPDSATSSWIFAFLDAAGRAAQNPTMSALLQGIEISDDDDGAGGVRVGREAFVVLARLLAANISAPDFDLQATREIVEDVLVPRLGEDATAQALLDELLDLSGVLVDPSSAAFAALQQFMGCVDRRDHDAAIPAMLFDFLTTEEIPVRDLLIELAERGAHDDASALRIAVVALLDAALLHPAPLGDVAGVVGRLLEPAPAAALLDVAVTLRGTGVFSELVSLVDTLVGCKGVSP
jgi:hypothetical protein